MSLDFLNLRRMSTLLQLQLTHSQVRHISNTINFSIRIVKWNNEWRLAPHRRPRCAMAWRRICEFKAAVMPKWILKIQQMENKRKCSENGNYLFRCIFDLELPCSETEHKTPNNREPGFSVFMQTRPKFLLPVLNAHFFPFSSVLNICQMCFCR